MEDEAYPMKPTILKNQKEAIQQALEEINSDCTLFALICLCLESPSKHNVIYIV